MAYWDPIRCQYVDETPEERVRQRWIQTMIHSLGYPKSLLVVEKDIASLPHKGRSFNPNRRLDLLCYTPAKEGLIPLLLIEFKSERRDEGGVKQLFGYNETVGATFLSLIGGEDAKTFWRFENQIHSVPFLPAYSQLLEKVPREL